jgi:DNA mismatch repair protein MutS
MQRQSIVFPPGDGATVDTSDESFQQDLHLDQVLGEIISGHEEHDLRSLFGSPLTTVRAVIYRQAVFRDLDGTALFGRMLHFTNQLDLMRRQLARSAKLEYERESQRWFLDAVTTYCDSTKALHESLAGAVLTSEALLSFRRLLGAYVRSQDFKNLVTDVEEVRQGLESVTYCVRIKEARVEVSRYANEDDYSTAIAATFARFREPDVLTPKVDVPQRQDMDHVEAKILDLVADLVPEPFERLREFCQRHHDFLAPLVTHFNRELHFYVAYLEFIAPLRVGGLSFCYPLISDESKDICVTRTFDVALAKNLTSERRTVVPNDFFLLDPERILVVTGPNQGGKTTFARTVGQVSYFGALGCPVAGTDARLFLFDRIYSHFERREDDERASGKLREDLLRLHAVLESATSDSLVILNEILTSTTLEDARELGRRVLRRLVELGCVVVCVTFVDEWANMDDVIVSMTSTVRPEAPDVRTYEIMRRPADGKAYALALAERCGLTFEQIVERITL